MKTFRNLFLEGFLKNANFIKFVFLTIVFYYPLNARTLDDVISSKQIYIAIYRDFPPYSYMENGEAKGIDIDIGKVIAKKMKVEPIWYWTGADETIGDDLRNVIWKGHIVHKKKADVMLRIPYDYNFIREKESTGELSNELVFMKAPYHAEMWAIGYDKNKIRNFNGLDTFAKYDIAVELDTFFDRYLLDYNLNIRPHTIHYKYLQNALQDLKTNKIYALGGLYTQVQYYLSLTKIKYKVIPLKIGGKPMWNIGIAVRSDSRDLGYEIDGIIEKLVKNKTIKKIFKKYNAKWKAPILE